VDDSWQVSVGSLMPFKPYESVDVAHPDGFRVLAGAGFIKSILIERGWSEMDALEYIASLRRLDEVTNASMDDYGDASLAAWKKIKASDWVWMDTKPR
jgi:hypothetical protein